MRLEDALFNWLQIKIVAEGRPDDEAAFKTLGFFEEILREDHGLQGLEVASVDSGLIQVAYEKDGQRFTQHYPREAGEGLLQDIISNPKYN
ncbi:hypothetical protein RB620_05995 [Paenibacillus sp. LHD-117]|uniref:hypothetical protein n=1 Tax=Paenibacillus sp. LHD-117 TaxID=3071412 RepID=UPI0027DEF174|nr:hypothetical protein [Paenibacillus sp. LHD-117]MDQ6418990.1 hypothetical protein [Paenibacillus sp. LHD-117]